MASGTPWHISLCENCQLLGPLFSWDFNRFLNETSHTVSTKLYWKLYYKYINSVISKRCWLTSVFLKGVMSHVSELSVTPCQNLLGNKHLSIKWNHEQHQARSVTLSASKCIVMLSKQIQSWDLLTTIFDLNWLLYCNVFRSPKMTTTGLVEYKYHKSSPPYLYSVEWILMVNTWKQLCVVNKWHLHFRLY